MQQIVLPGPGYYVYVAWGKRKTRPLYVGKTRGFHRRMAGHERSSAWWNEVHHFTLYVYGTEVEAIIAEADAISDLRPLYNQVGNQGHQVALARHLRFRAPRPPDYGPEITFDEISSDQLEIIRRVQNREPAA